jgi:hypothetical protein
METNNQRWFVLTGETQYWNDPLGRFDTMTNNINIVPSVKAPNSLRIRLRLVYRGVLKWLIRHS